MLPRILIAGVVSALTASVAAGAWQEEGAEAEPADDPIATSVAAYFRALHDEEVLFEGRVQREEDEAANPFAGMVIMGGPGGGEARERFEGEFEALSTDRGEALLVSKARLPGLTLFSDGETTLVSTLTEDGGLDVSWARTDLPALLNFEVLSRRAAEAEWKVSELAEGVGPRVLSTVMPAALIRSKPAGNALPFGQMEMFSERVVSVDLRLTVSADGELRSMEFTVHRSDPMAAMQQMAQEQMETGGGLGGEMRLEIDASSMGDLEGGPTQAASYQLRPVDRAPGLLLQARLEEMREVLAQR